MMRKWLIKVNGCGLKFHLRPNDKTCKAVQADSQIGGTGSLTCRYCGRVIKEENAIYCPFCAKPVRTVQLPLGGKTGFPITAGILTIIASCMSIIIGIAGVIAFANSFSYYYYNYYYRYYYGPDYGWLFLAIFDILAFAFGLTGGILSIRRRQFTLSIVGMSLGLVSGFVTMIVAGGLVRDGSWVGALAFGLPMIILSILSVIFAAVSKGEFTNG